MRRRWPHPFQRTIRRAVRTEGHGIHSGRSCRMVLSPLPENSGIRFFRTDLGQEIPCGPEAVDHLVRSVGLRQGQATVRTVEHLLAAFHLCGVANILVEVDAEELPFLDGSAYAFLRLLRRAGLRDQDAPTTPLGPSRPVHLAEGPDSITYIPADRTLVVCVTDFPHPMLRRRLLLVDMDRRPDAAVGRARTFGFERDLEALRGRGLGLGGDLSNTVLFTETGVRNRRLHYPDEAVRHKVLDFLGDMYLSGRPLRGLFVLHRNGHSLDVRFLRALLDAERTS